MRRMERLERLEASAVTAPSMLSAAGSPSAEGDVSPNESGRNHTFDVCSTTDGSHMVIIIRTIKWIRE